MADRVIHININTPAKADTAADTNDMTTVHIHVHHRLQDNVIGMAGMEDGVKPTLRLPFQTSQDIPIQRYLMTTTLQDTPIQR